MSTNRVVVQGDRILPAHHFLIWGELWPGVAISSDFSPRARRSAISRDFVWVLPGRDHLRNLTLSGPFCRLFHLERLRASRRSFMFSSILQLLGSALTSQGTRTTSVSEGTATTEDPEPFQTPRRSHSILRSPVIQRRFDPNALRACLYSLVRDSYPEDAPLNTMIHDATKMLHELSHSAGTQNPAEAEAEVETFLQSLLDAQKDRIHDQPEVSPIPGSRRRRRTPPREEEEASPRKRTRMEEDSDAEESTIMYDASEHARALTFVDLKA